LPNRRTAHPRAERPHAGHGLAAHQRLGYPLHPRPARPDDLPRATARIACGPGRPTRQWCSAAGHRRSATGRRQSAAGQRRFRQPSARQPTVRQPTARQPTLRQPMVRLPTLRQPTAG
jgi:hypothetical protein